MEPYVEALKRDIKSGFGVIEWNLLWRRWKFNNDSVISVFRKTAAKNADKIAIKSETQTWTFKMLDQFSNKVANYFTSLGFRAGDQMALMMNNKPEFIGIWLGLAKVGIITAFINTNNRLDLLINCLKAIKCKAIIYDYEFNQAFEDIYNEVNEIYPSMKYLIWSKDMNNNTYSTKFTSQSFSHLLDNYSKSSLDVYHKRNFSDHLVYIFTSGTTGGKVKAAIETDARMLLGASGHHIGYKLRKNDNIYVPLPLYHAFAGVLITGTCLLYGITLSISERFSATNFWTDCIKYNCTIGLYIGETCRYLLAQTPKPEDTKHQIRAMCGIGLRKAYWNQFKTRFAIKHIFEFYGASEANVYLVNLNDKEGSCGFIPWYYGIFLRLIYSGCIVRVDPMSLEPLRNRKGLCKMIRPGEIGVIVGVHNKISPLHEFKGYTDSGETNKKWIFNIRSKGDSGFMSGDLVEMDKFGYMYFKDRCGDTFRFKGENVSTTDVEAVIQSTLNHKDCTVFGVTVGQSEGKAGMAVINANINEIDLQELAQQLSKRLPSYAIPLFIKLTADIEVTGTFKLIKYKLQNMGFTPQSNDDFIAVYDKNINSYKRMTNEIYESILSGELEF